MTRTRRPRWTSRTSAWTSSRRRAPTRTRLPRRALLLSHRDHELSDIFQELTRQAMPRHPACKPAVRDHAHAFKIIGGLELV